MTSDRQRALIERLLSEAEVAVGAGQWDVVARHAQSVLVLEANHLDALALKAIAERLPASASTQLQVPDLGKFVGALETDDAPDDPGRVEAAHIYAYLGRFTHLVASGFRAQRTPVAR